jgi:hypothetical protein
MAPDDGSTFEVPSTRLSTAFRARHVVPVTSPASFQGFATFMSAAVVNVPRRSNHRIVHWEGGDAVVVDRLQSLWDQFAIEAHQSHPGVREEGSTDRLVSMLNNNKQLVSLDAFTKALV